MKKCLFVAAMLIMGITSLVAQAPQQFNYQAVVRGNTGTPLANNTAVALRFTIRNGSAGGASVFTETQNTTTNQFGLVNVQIGSVGNLSTVNWANGTKFLQVETDVNNTGTFTDMGTTQLLSVPYALYAKSAGTVSGGGSGGNFTHYIGEQFGGGIIFHLWKDAQGVEHGLIVDKTDLSTSQVWSNIQTTLIGASAQSSWDGLSNSNAIVGQAGHTSSASALCLNSTNGAQSDWYLPSVQELNMLWNNYYTVARSLTQISGATQLQPVTYWSSTEDANGFAWYFNFNGGVASNTNKANAFYVRAVRAF